MALRSIRCDKTHILHEEESILREGMGIISLDGRGWHSEAWERMTVTRHKTYHQSPQAKDSYLWGEL